MSRNVFDLEVDLEIPKREKKLGKMFLLNFISSKDGREKGTETRQRSKHAKRLPYYGMMAEKKGIQQI